MCWSMSIEFLAEYTCLQKWHILMSICPLDGNWALRILDVHMNFNHNARVQVVVVQGEVEGKVACGSLGGNDDV